jgi:hypothetical protein
MEVKKAIDWLEKVAISVHNGIYGIKTEDTPSALPSSGGEVADGAAGAETKIKTEIIIPRIIVDVVKKRYFSLKGYCYNVDVNLTHSDSKSKQFAKLTLSADMGSDMERACEYLNTELTQMCLSAGAPMTNMGVYKDFGFLGGELSSSDYALLFDPKDDRGNSLNVMSGGVSTDCSEDLQHNTFAQSFMEANRCSIWIQAEEDMGRVSNNRIINESNPYKSRKIYYGVTPSRVATLWGYLKTRINDMKRGVQFLHLGPDRIYQHALLEPIKKSTGCNYFFEFVRQTSGASVSIESTTGSSFLRIDGGENVKMEGGDAGVDVGEDKISERIDIALDLILLQIELLRDHHIRKQRWGFGRDWALLLENASNGNPTTNSTAEGGGTASSSNLQEIAASSTPPPLSASTTTTTLDSMRLSDQKVVGTACLEISEIVTGMQLSEKVAAHACIIFYRYINLLVQPSSPSSDNCGGGSNNNAAVAALNMETSRGGA